jgi:hypothetical protein
LSEQRLNDVNPSTFTRCEQSSRSVRGAAAEISALPERREEGEAKSMHDKTKGLKGDRRTGQEKIWRAARQTQMIEQGQEEKRKGSGEAKALQKTKGLNGHKRRGEEKMIR